MNKVLKIIIVIVLIAAVGIVIAVKQKESNVSTETSTLTKPDSASSPKSIAPDGEPQNDAKVTASIPKLIDLGADKCIPCKMMKPILEELTKEYAGKLQVQFHDVWKDPAPGQKYNIKLIPTQIFLDPDGKELFRHQGFFSKEDILAKWKELGFDFNSSPKAVH